MMSVRAITEQQIMGLQKLAQFIGARYECNFMIQVSRDDVAYLRAVDAHRASQIVYATDTHLYDVWTFDGLVLKKPGLALEQAAELVVREYFTAKAARIVKHSPHLKRDQVLAKLYEGYQQKKPEGHA
jgi:hypothetical protein